MQIPLIKPFINNTAKQNVIDVLESGYLTEGPVTKSFETKFREYIGCKYAISATSCTTGLELALRALKIGPGDEVIVPDYTYPATVSVVSIVGATPVLVDIDKDSMLIDMNLVEKAITENTRAIIPVSLFGNPLDFDKLNDLKEKYKLYIIEDAACSLGSEFKGVKTGNSADISVFSLHPRKFITTGEGGMITTNNSEWAEWMDSYKHFGIDMIIAQREGVNFSMIGTNYKLSNVLSAIGLAQMEHINELLNRRRELAENYDHLLSGIPNISLPEKTRPGLHSYQSYCIYVSNRDTIMRKMREAGVEVQIGTYALHMHKAYTESSKIRYGSDFKSSKYAFDHCLVLPLYHELSFEIQEYIIDKLQGIAGL